MVLPVRCRARRADGDAAFLLLWHEVHGSSAVMNLAHAVYLVAVEENALGQRRFARINMGNDADVADGWDVHGNLLAGGREPCKKNYSWPVSRPNPTLCVRKKLRPRP